LKVASLSKSKLSPQTTLPFSAIESKFLIGLAFRFTLRDIIYNSQQRNNQGILHHEIHSLKRGAAYQEIMQFSYEDYLKQMVIPYYLTRGMDMSEEHSFETAVDLRTYESGLRANPNIRLLINQNDFLLSENDFDWFQNTFSTNTLTVFKQGGHMGNLSNPVVQKTIVNALGGLTSQSHCAADHVASAAVRVTPHSISRLFRAVFEKGEKDFRGELPRR
jgi:hypothetical protein